MIHPKYLSNASTNRIISSTLIQVGLPLLGNNERVRLFSPVHEHHYIAAFKMFLDNPILGIGPNNFREQCKKTKFKVNKLPFLEDKIYKPIRISAKKNLGISNLLNTISNKIDDHFKVNEDNIISRQRHNR